jgi:hypothetical protein
VPTTIDSISIPTNIKEGQPLQLSATTTTTANNTLTYNWYINNATTPIVGKTINYQFADNGIYPVKLTVIDNNGTVTTQPHTQQKWVDPLLDRPISLEMDRTIITEVPA